PCRCCCRLAGCRWPPSCRTPPCWSASWRRSAGVARTQGATHRTLGGKGITPTWCWPWPWPSGRRSGCCRRGSRPPAPSARPCTCTGPAEAAVPRQAAVVGRWTQVEGLMSEAVDQQAEQPDYILGLGLGRAQEFTALAVLERHREPDPRDGRRLLSH